MTTLTTGSPATTTSTTGLQPFAMPYAQQNLANTWALTQQPYQPYQGQQNAAMTGLQNQSFAAAQNLGVNPNSIQAGNTAGQAANNLLNTNYNPIQAGYQSVNAPQLNGYQMQGPGNVYSQNFNNYQAANLMNPYLQQSLAPQLNLLQQQQGMQAAQNAGQATQAGAFGGSRFGIQNALQNQANQLATSNLVGNAYNTAFNNAQTQFNTQNAASMQAQAANQNANLATNQANLSAALGVQSLGAQQNLAAQQANQNAGLTAQQANINQQQYGAGLGLQANQSASQAAATQNNIGQSQYNQNNANISLQNQLGVQQQQYQQGLLNTQYQNYQNQLNYPYQQAAYMQNMVNGYPATSSISTTQPSTPSYLQQAAAVGTAGLGVSSLLGSGLGSAISDGWSWLTGKEGGMMGMYASGGRIEGEQVKHMATGKTAGSNSQAALIQAIIADEEASGHEDRAQGLAQLLGLSGTTPAAAAPNIQTAAPSSNAGQAGLNASISQYQAPAAYSATGSTPQQRSARPVAASPDTSASSASGLPSMQDLIAAQKEASRNTTTEQIAQDPNGLANYFAQDKTPEQLAAQQAQPVASEAQGGLQHVYLSDDMVPSEYATGGITDVARFDEGGKTETPEQTQARVNAMQLSDLQPVSPGMGAASLPAGPDLTAAQPAPQAQPDQTNVELQKQMLLQNLYNNQQMPYQQAAQAAPAQANPASITAAAPQAATQQATQQAPQGYVPPELQKNISDAGIRTQAGAAGYNMLKQAYQDLVNQKSPTAEDWQAHQDRIYEHNKKLMGDSPIPELIKANEESKRHNADIERMQKGLALIAAAPEFLEGNQAGRGIAKGISAAAKGWGSAMLNKEMADSALDKMNTSLKVAQRAEQQGQVKLASDANKQFFDEQEKFNKYLMDSKVKIAEGEGKIAKEEQGFRPVIDTSNKVTAASLRASQISDEFEAMKADPANKGKTDIELKAMANAKVNSQYSAGMPGAVDKNQTAKDIEEAKAQQERQKEGAASWGSAMWQHQNKDLVKHYNDVYGGNAGAKYAEHYSKGQVESPGGAKPATSTTTKGKPVEVTAPPVSALKEGIHTTFKNGQTWTLVNGSPIQVK